MDYTIRKTISVIAGIALTINILSVDDIGAGNDVSLQAPEMEITTAVPFDYVPSSEFVASSHISAEVDENTDDLEDRTFIITVEDDEEDDLMDPDDFVHDGNHVWVSVDIANLRSDPSTESDIIGQITYSTDVVRISYGSEWSLVRDDYGNEGYVLSSLLSDEEIVLPTATPTPMPTATPTPSPTVAPTSTPTPTPAPAVPAFTETSYNATVYASCVLNVRSGPGTEYALVTGYNEGDAITVTAATDNGWYRTSDGNYVKADLCLDTPPAQPETVNPVTEAPQIDTSGYSDFGSYCLQFVGTPYVYSGSSPSGFDCSGYVSYIYANYYGISLPHNAAEIAAMGSGVSADGVQVGDVLCHDYNSDGYIDHVSLYIGNGTCIHASNSRMGVITSAWPMGSVVTIRRFV